MSLDTRFSLEDLDYLKTLPERIVGPLPQEEIVTLVDKAWVRASRPSSMWAKCVAAGHDLWAHHHDGYTYFRHGDMLCRMEDADWRSRALPQDRESELREWLDSVHAQPVPS